MASLMRTVWRIIVGVVGGTILVIGILLLVLPGPAFLVIPVGLAILASEFLWARRLLEKVRSRLRRRQEKPPAGGRSAGS